MTIDNPILTISILKIITHDCYRAGHFYYSFKGFLYLEKFIPNEENTNGKLASATGFCLISSVLRIRPEED